MKRVVYKRGELPKELSPITPKGQIVYSTIKMFSDPQDRTIEYTEQLTPDSEEAIKVLRFLDEQNGIGWTPDLKRIEKELREALLDLMATDTPKERKAK